MGRIKSGSLLQKAFCMHARESRRRRQSWARSTLERSITPFLLKSVCELGWMFRECSGSSCHHRTAGKQSAPCPFLHTVFRDVQFPHSCVGMGALFAFETEFGLCSMNCIHYPCIPHMSVANPFPSISYVKGEK